MKRASTLPPAGEPEPLTFLWPERSASFVLPVFFILAVLCHGVAFYLFQIVYPPSTAVTPPTAQLLYISPDSPENLALLQWVDAQTPSTVARLRDTPLPAEAGPIRYTPSYETAGTLPKDADLGPPPVDYPAAYDAIPGPTVLAATGEAVAPATPIAPIPSRSIPSSLSFSQSLRGFENSEAPPLFPPANQPGAIAQSTAQNNREPDAPHTGRSLQPTSFFIGLNRRGELLYTFAHRSSGDKTLDQRAATTLRDYPFRHPDPEPATDITWGYATFTWGIEAYNTAATPASTPAPEPQPAGEAEAPPATP